MILTQNDNCVLDVRLIDSGIPGVKTLEIHRQFPQAQHPRWQRVTQINGTTSQLWELGSYIMQHAKP